MAYRNEHLFITVPKNDQGYQDYDIGIDESENFLSYKLSPEEYDRLFKAGVFRILEGMFKDVYISDGERNMITAEQFNKVGNAIDIVDGVFMNAVRKAKEYGTCVFLDF